MSSETTKWKKSLYNHFRPNKNWFFKISASRFCEVFPLP